MTRMLLIVALLVFTLSGKLSAQERIDSDPFADRIREMVFSMNHYISDMVGECANRDLATCKQHRDQCKDAALALFVGGGESYEIAGVRKEPVQMITMGMSANGDTIISSCSMDAYFQKLIGLVSGDNPRYAKVTITSSEVSEILVSSSLLRIDDNLYECRATFGQRFYGERGDGVVYQDYTEKHVKCFVKIEETNAGKEVVILLGDMICGESHRL